MLAMYEKHPHARGEDLTKEVRCDKIERNTPTHVGKTVCAAVNGGVGSKHPHARGEDSV